MARKALFNLLIVVGAVGAGVALSRAPYKVLHDQQSRTSQSLAEMHKSERHREELLREDARYRGSIGKEELARAAGYLRPNEKPADR